MSQETHQFGTPEIAMCEAVFRALAEKLILCPNTQVLDVDYATEQLSSQSQPHRYTQPIPLTSLTELLKSQGKDEIAVVGDLTFTEAYTIDSGLTLEPACVSASVITKLPSLTAGGPELRLHRLIAINASGDGYVNEEYSQNGLAIRQHQSSLAEFMAAVAREERPLATADLAMLFDIADIVMPAA